MTSDGSEETLFIREGHSKADILVESDKLFIL